MMRSLRPLCFLLAPVCGIAAAEAATPPIGTTAVANNEVTGTLGSDKRSLKSGARVFQNERIQTGQGASAQFMFRDETTLKLDANSSVVLDKLIYDPDKKKGEMVLRAVSGSFRFISGSAPKENYKINTPVGTIGIRGTVIQVALLLLRDPTGRMRPWVRLGVFEGGATICNLLKQCRFLKAGTYLVASSDGRLGRPSREGGGACSSSGSFSASGGADFCTSFKEVGNPYRVVMLTPASEVAIAPPEKHHHHKHHHRHHHGHHGHHGGDHHGDHHGGNQHGHHGSNHHGSNHHGGNHHGGNHHGGHGHQANHGGPGNHGNHYGQGPHGNNGNHYGQNGHGNNGNHYGQYGQGNNGNHYGQRNHGGQHGRRHGQSHNPHGHGGSQFGHYSQQGPNGHGRSHRRGRKPHTVHRHGRPHHRLGNRRFAATNGPSFVRRHGHSGPRRGPHPHGSPQ